MYIICALILYFCFCFAWDYLFFKEINVQKCILLIFVTKLKKKWTKNKLDYIKTSFTEELLPGGKEIEDEILSLQGIVVCGFCENIIFAIFCVSFAIGNTDVDTEKKEK